MYKSQRVISVIQARGGSKGIPKKNIYPVNGHPLIAYTICAALESKYIDRVIVFTDSVEIAEVARLYGAEVPFMRTESLSGDTVASVTSLIPAVREAESFYSERYDVVIELPCVAPLRISFDIDSAIEKLVEDRADSVISVVNTGEKHPIRLKRIVNDKIHDFCQEYPEPAIGSRRQDLEACYIRNGAIYAMKRRTLLTLGSRHGADSRPYVMPEERSINIDTRMDLIIADLMIKAGYCENRPRIARSLDLKYGSGVGPKILITTPLHFLGNFEKKLLENYNCVIASNANHSDVVDLIRGCEGFLCAPSPTYKIDSRIIESSETLKVISTPSTGISHIDEFSCQKHDVKLLSLRTSPRVKDIVASSEYTFALLLAVVRKISQSFDGVKQGYWRDAEDRYRSIELSGKTLGIIGFGRIGGSIANYAGAMGMDVIAFDPYRKITAANVTQAKSHKDVLSNADVVCICVHLNEETKRMVNAEWFETMKVGSYFINTSRGEVLDESALMEFLSNGRLAGAGVDVISNEQCNQGKKHPLVEYARANNNLLITPHIAGLTLDSELKAAEIAFDSLINYLAG